MVSSSRDVLRRLSARIDEPLPSGLQVERGEIAVPRPAATVVLLRDHGGRLQTYALHRHAKMPFAPGMVVFPGGRLDPADGVPDADHGLDDPALRRCAVRETEEETGVRLQPGDLAGWAHWITPEVEPRRYDTAFYLAALPSGQSAVDISGETSKAEWRSVADLLTAADAGELQLMPPTRSVLLELVDHPDVATAVAAVDGRIVETVRPRPVYRADGWFWSYDDAPDRRSDPRSPDA